jgi:hypothetical protein
MNRRDFFKSVAAVIAVVCIPELPAQKFVVKNIDLDRFRRDFQTDLTNIMAQEIQKEIDQEILASLAISA